MLFLSGSGFAAAHELEDKVIDTVSDEYCARRYDGSLHLEDAEFPLIFCGHLCYLLLGCCDRMKGEIRDWFHV